jgi:hypothetical protein
MIRYRNVIEGKIERDGKTRIKIWAATIYIKETRRYCKGSTGLHSVENLFFKRLWTCLKIDYVMMEDSRNFTYAEYLHYKELSIRDLVHASLGQSRYRFVVEEKSVSLLPRTET